MGDWFFDDRYFRLNLLLADELRDADGAEDRLAGYDQALRRARWLYERQMYSPGNNCYQFVSHCLNVLGYRGAAPSVLYRVM